MKQFIKKLIGFSLGPVLGAVISFITLPITTFFITPTEFGKASMFAVMQSLIVTFIYLGIDQSYTREYHSIKNKKVLFQNAMAIPFVTSVILGLVIFIFRYQFSVLLFGTEDYSNISILFSLLIIISVIERFILLYIRMQEKAVEYSLFSLFVKITILITTIVFLLLGNRSFLTIVYSTILGQFIGDFILILKYRYLFKWSDFTLDKDLIKRMLIFGIPLIVAASVNNLLNTSGRLFLRNYSNYHELGIYNAALKIASLLQIVQTAFTGFWVPTAYRWYNEKKSLKHFSIVSDALLLCMTCLFFTLLLLKTYIAMILSNEYSQSQYIMGLLSISPILYTMSETSTLGIVFSRKSYLNIWVSILSLVPNLLLNYMLIPKYGTVGAAISIAFSYIVFCLSRTFFSYRAGFKIKYVKQTINIFIFFIAAIINVSSGINIILATVVLFIIALLSQISTFKSFIDIKKNKEEWNFN